MDIAEVSSALSDVTRLRLIEILSNRGAMSSKQAHEEFTDRYNSHRRESIYKALETLVDAEILVKTYSQDTHELMYDVATEKLLIDLKNLEIYQSDVCESE